MPLLKPYLLIAAMNLVFCKIAGDDDPYAPTQNQTELFTNLGRGVDRVWSIIAKADHAVHLSDTRHKFVENLNNFLKSE